MSEPCTPDALLEAVRGLRVADPDLGFKPLLAKLQEQQPDLEAGTKEVRKALKALKAESEAKAKTEAGAESAQHAPDEGSATAALSLACVGCGRLPSDMDDGREKHPMCAKSFKQKLPTTYWCCLDCPGNPGAWEVKVVEAEEEVEEAETVEAAGPKSEPEPKPEPTSEPKSQPEPEPKSEPESEPKSEIEGSDEEIEDEEEIKGLEQAVQAVL